MNRHLSIIILSSLAVLLATACRTDTALSNDSSMGKGELYQKGATAETDIPIDEVYFPGKLFREFIGKQYDENGDGHLSQGEREKVTKIKMVSITAAHNQSIGEDADSWKWYEVWTEEGEENLDMTGIRYFINLENVYLEAWYSLIGEEELEQLSRLKKLTLRCEGWDKLLQPHMESLEKLDVGGIELKDQLDVQFLPNLKILDIEGYSWLGKVDPNRIVREELDVSANHKLEVLDCSGLGLKRLNLSKNPKLRKLICYDNQLKHLDLSHNTELEMLNCDNNWLKKLNTYKLKKIKVINCSKNQLKNLDLSKNKKLEEVCASKNKLQSLNVTQNYLLRAITCKSNRLKILNVNNNKKLDYLVCSENKLKEIKTSTLKKLTWLECDNNQITGLDLKKNKVLENLDCADNKISSLDLSKNLELNSVYCINNKISSLDLKQNKKIQSIFVENNGMTQISFPITVLRYYGREEIWSNAQGNNLRTLDIRGYRKLNKEERRMLPYWITGGIKRIKQKDIMVEKIIVNRKFFQKERKFLNQLKKKFKFELKIL